MAYPGEKVQVVMGDLFELAPDGYALAHCVGAGFRIGKGIAVEFLKRYHGKEYLLSQNKIPGQVAVLPSEMCNRSAPIFYLVSKLHSSDHSPLWKEFCSCLQELLRLCLEMGVKHVAMPLIGCGEDHLRWPDMEKQLYSTFQGSLVDIHVFKLINPPGCVLPAVPLQPTFRGWQMLGDSNFVRLSLNCDLVVYHKNSRERFPKQLGLCISGQRLRRLLCHVTRTALCSKVILMVGTNDVFHLSRHPELKKHIKKTWRANLFHLLKLLSERCEKVLIVTIPPIPAISDTEETVKWVNNLLVCAASYKKYNNLHVMNWSERFQLDNRMTNTSLFETKMGPPGNQRNDFIHLNHQGQQLLVHCLNEAINSIGDKVVSTDSNIFKPVLDLISNYADVCVSETLIMR